MKNIINKTLVSSGVVTLTPLALAHDGEHIVQSTSLTFYHLITELDHMLMLAGAIVLAVSIRLIVKKLTVNKVVNSNTSQGSKTTG